MSTYRKFYYEQGNIQGCDKNSTNNLTVLIFPHNIWTGNSTWEQNCILIYLFLKSTAGYMSHHGNSPQSQVVGFSVFKYSGYFE